MTRLWFTLALVGLIAGCSSMPKLKQPCSDPGYSRYVDDCGPMLPVNQAIDDALLR
jgi:uncharacterized lipoprotein